MQATSSESREHSQNPQTEAEIGTFKFKFEEKPMEKHNLFNGSELGEHSQDSRKSPCIRITEHKDLKEIKLPLKPKQLQELQKNDTYCRDIAKKLHKDRELQKIFIKKQEYCIDYGLRTEEPLSVS